jgi:hypothetical protein
MERNRGVPNSELWLSLTAKSRTLDLSDKIERQQRFLTNSVFIEEKIRNTQKNQNKTPKKTVGSVISVKSIFQSWVMNLTD